jgi:hypothetical protein
MPQLRLEVVVHADNPAERLIFVNSRRYREGDRVDGKFLVEEITPDGAVLSYQGQRLLLKN